MAPAPKYRTTVNATSANAGREESADASSPTSPNSIHHSPCPRLSNHSEANSVSTSASNAPDTSVAGVVAGLMVTPVTRYAAHPAAANQMATGAQASTTRPRVIGSSGLGARGDLGARTPGRAVPAPGVRQSALRGAGRSARSPGRR